MRAVVSEIDTLGSDLGFDSLPWELRSERPPAPVSHAVSRPVADHAALPCGGAAGRR